MKTYQSVFREKNNKLQEFGGVNVASDDELEKLVFSSSDEDILFDAIERYDLTDENKRIMVTIQNRSIDFKIALANFFIKGYSFTFSNKESNFTFNINDVKMGYFSELRGDKQKLTIYMKDSTVLTAVFQ